MTVTVGSSPRSNFAKHFQRQYLHESSSSEQKQTTPSHFPLNVAQLHRARDFVIHRQSFQRQRREEERHVGVEFVQCETSGTPQRGGGGSGRSSGSRNSSDRV